MKAEPDKDNVSGQPAPLAPALVESVALRPKRSLGPWKVLRNRNYALLFWGQLIAFAGTQMQVVAVAWQVYLLTHSAVALGVLGLVQAIPRLVFSLVGGVFADVFDRRKLLLVIELALAATSAVLALCTILHVINLAIIYVVVLLAATVSAFEFPTRQAIVPGLVKREDMADALSLSMVMVQLTAIVGPAAGGFAIAWIGVANTYWVDVVSYFVVIGSLLLMVVGRVARQGLGVVMAILLWGVCITAFGFFPAPLWLGVLFLAGAGAADMVSMILRGLVLQLITPDEYRGRTSGVNGMFVIGGPMLGQFESGLVASIFSPEIAVISGGLACIVATVVIVALVPGLLRVKVK